MCELKLYFELVIRAAVYIVLRSALWVIRGLIHVASVLLTMQQYFFKPPADRPVAAEPPVYTLTADAATAKARMAYPPAELPIVTKKLTPK